MHAYSKTFRLLKWIGLAFAGILILNTIHIFNLYIVRYGNLDFSNPKDHLFVFGNLVLALISVLVSWHFIKSRITKSPPKLLVSFFLGLVVFSLFTSVYYILLRLSHGATTSISFLAGHIVFSFSSAFIHVAGLTLAVLFLNERNRIGMENIKISQEKQVLEHQLLMKNLEPHFLLNSLSNFSHMIKKDQVEAEKFLDSFTNIYRYFMKHNQSELVSLEEEFEFLTHYFYLIQKRYGNAYEIENLAMQENGYIIPFAIQMCVENAIKHNEGFDNDPLKISIVSELEYVTVINDLRPVKSQGNTGYGIKNLKLRSKIYTGKEVLIIEDKLHFSVKIPVVMPV